MSVKIGLYDFFSYTLPGVFYFLIGSFWLSRFGLINFDQNLINTLSPFLILVVGGAGFVIGLLLDPIAYRWMRLTQGRNIDVVKTEYQEFCKRYPWLDVKFQHTDWNIFLQIIKIKSTDVALDVEQHNVESVMLRNISFGFLISALFFILFFFAINSSIWNIVLFAISLLFSFIALKKSVLRRKWFYNAIFTAFAANYLDEARLAETNLLAIKGIRQLVVSELANQPVEPSLPQK